MGKISILLIGLLSRKWCVHVLKKGGGAALRFVSKLMNTRISARTTNNRGRANEVFDLGKRL